jgi:nucleoside-diphosphate-sugar epimerase
MLRTALVDKPVVSRGEVRADEVLDTVADIGKARRVFGWEPRVSLVEGLRRIIQARLAPPSGVREAANG